MPSTRFMVVPLREEGIDHKARGVLQPDPVAHLHRLLDLRVAQRFVGALPLLRLRLVVVVFSDVAQRDKRLAQPLACFALVCQSLF